MKVIPLRLLMDGEPKLYKPIGAKFCILVDEGVNLVFIPKWYMRKNGKLITINKKQAVKYVFNGIEKFNKLDTWSKAVSKRSKSKKKRNV